MKYIIFNDVDNRNLGIDVEVTGWSRPILPENRDELVYVEGVTGSRLNKKPLGNRPITIHFRAMFKNESERIQTVEVLTKWLYSRDFVKLVMSDEPELYYMAKVFDGSDLEPELFQANFSITFICQPLKYGRNRLESFNQSQGTVSVDGTYESPPTISFRISQSTSLLEFELNGEKIIYEDSDNPLTANTNILIDVPSKEFRVNGELKVLEVSGYFVYLEHGDNPFSVNVPCDGITFDWQELYLYKVDSNEN